jgi:predicted small lipoprotein YifL
MRALFLTLLCLTALAACGNKGDLVLRDPLAPPAMSDADMAAAKATADAEALQSDPVDEDGDDDQDD